MIQYHKQKEQYAEYWVVFTQGVHWIARWLRPNYSHIFIVTRDPYNWVILNPTRRYLQLLIPPVPPNETPLPGLIKPTDSVVKICFTERDSMCRYGTIGLLNCVTWTKYILGLRISSLTPWRLFQRLINFSTEEMDRHGIQSIEQVKL